MSDLKELTDSEFRLKMKQDDEKLVELIDQVICPLKGFNLSYAQMVLQAAIQRVEIKSIIPH